MQGHAPFAHELQMLEHWLHHICPTLLPLSTRLFGDPRSLFGPFVGTKNDAGVRSGFDLAHVMQSLSTRKTCICGYTLYLFA